MTGENYISLTTSKLSACKHVGYEYFCKLIFLVKTPAIISDNCVFNFFYNMTPKAAVLDTGDSLLLNNLGKPWYLHCDEHNSCQCLLTM